MEAFEAVKTLLTAPLPVSVAPTALASVSAPPPPYPGQHTEPDESALGRGPHPSAHLPAAANKLRQVLL